MLYVQGCMVICVIGGRMGKEILIFVIGLFFLSFPFSSSSITQHLPQKIQTSRWSSLAFPLCFSSPSSPFQLQLLLSLIVCLGHLHCNT